MVQPRRRREGDGFLYAGGVLPLHGQVGNVHTAFVPDEIVDRFCVLGTADDHIAKLKQLKDIGVDQFAGYLQHDNKEETLRVYGESVMPILRTHVTAKS